MKERIDKLNFIKIGNFCSVKDNNKRIEDKPQSRRKYLQKTYMRKDCHPKYKKLLKLNNKKTNNLFQKWAKDLSRHVTKEGTEMANSIWKNVLHPVLTGKCRLTTMWYLYTPFRMSDAEHWQHQTTGTLIHCWWECKMLQSLWMAFWQFLTN